MATMTNFASHLLLLQKSSRPPLRCLPTVVTATPVNSGKDNLVSKVKLSRHDESSNLAEILEEYNSQGNGIKRQDVRDLGHYFRNRKNFKAAIQLYEWLEINNRELISNAEQAVLIDLLYKAEGLASAENYFSGLSDSEKTNKTYGSLLSCYCREKVLDKALEIFNKIKELNYMSTLNYNNILSLYISTGQPEKVPSLVEEMEGSDFRADQYTWNILINSYAAMGNLDAAEQVLEQMKSNNIKCGSFTYGNMATMFVNSGLHEKAKAYLELMENIENEPYRDAVKAFRMRSLLYSEIKDLSGVVRAWESLKSTKSGLSSTTYLLMLLALSKLGAKAMLEEIYQEWEEKWVERCKEKPHEKFDFRLPNVVMEFYLDQNMIRDATDLYEKVSKRSSEPNLKAVNLFTTLLVKKSEIDLALDYLEIGIEKSGLVKVDWFPQQKTIDIFMKYFEENKDLARVERFVQILKKASRVDASVYSSLLSNAEVAN